MDYNCVWHVEAERLKFDEHLSWREVARGVERFLPDMDEVTRMEKVRRVLRRSPRYGQVEQADFQRGSVEYKSDGQIVSEKFITLRDGIDITPEDIIFAHGLDVDKWEVVSYKNNFWNSQVTGGGKQISYQSKLTARPKSDSVTFSDFDRYFQSKTFSNDKPHDDCGDNRVPSLRWSLFECAQIRFDISQHAKDAVEPRCSLALFHGDILKPFIELFVSASIGFRVFL